MAVETAARSAFDQPNVKAWLSSGDQIELILGCAHGGALARPKR
jgi:hypothetical protein